MQAIEVLRAKAEEPESSLSPDVIEMIRRQPINNLGRLEGTADDEDEDE